MKRQLLASLIVLSALAGCVTQSAPAGGVRWFKPWTWGSTSEARKAEKATERRDGARENAIKAAQKTAHETQLALDEAPQSRPVDVATDANNETVSLLDQVAGPLPSDELATLRKRNTDLLSENAQIRAKAEAERKSDRDAIGELSRKLADTQAALDKANADLPAAQRREAELANKYRTLQWTLAGLAVLAVIISAGLLYVRIAYGGIPMAVGKGLAALRAKNPAAADAATSIFDSYLNRSEQLRISRHA